MLISLSDTSYKSIQRLINLLGFEIMTANLISEILLNLWREDTV